MANKNMARENSYILEDRARFEDRNEDQDKTSSLPWASFNFINSIIGSGVIGIPYAFHEAGFGLGILLLILVAYITDYSLILMVRCGNLSGRFTYQGIMEAAFGRPGYILLSFLQFIYPFTAMVSYNVVVGDTLTKVIVRITGCEPDSVLGRREVVVLVATLLITIPLCLYRDIARLAKVSFFSLICIAFILISIIVKIGTMRELIPPDSNMWRLVNWDIVPAIAIMAFAFMCHHNTFLIYGSIHEANQKRWDIVTHISIFTSMCVSFLFGVAGYATFAGYSQGDLLENYCWDDDLMNFSRVLFSVQILLTFPIECFVTRDVVETSLLGKNANVPMSERTHYLLTLAIIGSTYFISMATDCLGVVLELNGVVAAVPLAYILPAIIYLRLEEGSVFSRRKLPSLALAAFGFLVAGVGTLFMFVDFDQSGDSCSHGKIMFYCEGNGTVVPTLKSF